MLIQNELYCIQNQLFLQKRSIKVPFINNFICICWKERLIWSNMSVCKHALFQLLYGLVSVYLHTLSTLVFLCLGCLVWADMSSNRRRQVNLSSSESQMADRRLQGQEKDRGPALTWWVMKGHVRSRCPPATTTPQSLF